MSWNCRDNRNTVLILAKSDFWEKVRGQLYIANSPYVQMENVRADVVDVAERGIETGGYACVQISAT